MSSPFNAIQTAIYTRLANYSALTSLIGPNKVFDNVPQSAKAPYVVIGDDTATESDTKTGNGWEFTVTIHCWDFDKAGRKSTKAIMSQIYAALHRSEASISLPGFSLIYMTCEFQECFPETVEGSQDHFYHGVQRFRALIRT